MADKYLRICIHCQKEVRHRGSTYVGLTYFEHLKKCDAHLKAHGEPSYLPGILKNHFEVTKREQSLVSESKPRTRTDIPAVISWSELELISDYNK